MAVRAGGPRRARVTLGLSRRDLWGVKRFSAEFLFEAVADLDVGVVATLTALQLQSPTVMPAFQDL